jgi:hypothetical protein
MQLPPFRSWLGQAFGHPADPDQADVPVSALTELASGVLATDPAASARPAHWTPSRLLVAERLWGKGYVTAGGGREAKHLATPIGLSSAATVLLLGAGAGGIAELLVRDFGAWVVGYEADPQLLAAAIDHVRLAGAAVAKRATIDPLDPLAPSFRANFCHHAVVLDAIRAAPMEPLLGAVSLALKPHGQIVMAEFVATTALDPADPAIAAWCRLEGRSAGLHSEPGITRALARLGFDVRVVEDISARHMQLALRGWKGMVHGMGGVRPFPAEAAALVHEAELWTRRIRLMHDGVIRLVRWHALGAVHAKA